MSDLPKLPYRGTHFRLHARGYFYVEFYDRRTRRRKSVSLGEDQGQAFLEATELARRYAVGDYDPWRDRKDDIPLEEAIDVYLRRFEQQGKRSAYNVRNTLQLFDAAHPRAFLVDISPDDVRDFVYRPHFADWTKRGYYTKLTTFFRFAVGEGWIRKSPSDEVDRPDVAEKKPTYMTHEEYEGFLQTIDEEIARYGDGRLVWLKDYVMLGVGSGLRPNELRHLRWRDVDLKQGLIHVTQYGKFRTKSGKDRTVPIFPPSRIVLETRPRTHELILTGMNGGMLNKRMIGRSFASMRDKAGLRPEITPKTTRSTFASWLVSKGTPLVRVKDWLGHSTLLITEKHYAYLMPTDAEQWFDAFIKTDMEPG